LDYQKEKIFWGWYVVAGAFFLMAFSHGARYCFGIFVQPLTAVNGWSRSVVSLAASINLFVYALGGIGSGKLIDRIAPRWITTIGALVGSAGFFLCTRVSSPLGFYLAYGLLCGIGSSWTGSITMNTSVGKWFDRKRGLAIGISSMGISFGTITLTATTGYVVEHFPWEAGFCFLGALMLFPGIAISQAILHRTVPEAYGLMPDGEPPPLKGPQILPPYQPVDSASPAAIHVQRDSRFWTIALCHGTAVMTSLLTFVHQVPYAVENGIERIAAAGSLSAIGLSGLVGQLFFGWISDRIGDPKYAAALGYLSMAASMGLLLQVRTVQALFFYAVVFGFGFGCLGPLLPILTADRFGRRHMGSIFGMLNLLVVGIGGFLGPFVGGLIYDSTGSYRHAWKLNLLLLTLMAAAIITLKRDRVSGFEKDRSSKP
jgi:MFS family permease